MHKFVKPAVFLILIIWSYSSFAQLHKSGITIQYRFITNSKDAFSEKKILKGTDEEYFVSRDVRLNEFDIEKAKAEKDEFGRDVVTIELNERGKKRFIDITGERFYGRMIGVVIDNQLIFTAKIREPVINGKTLIAGKLTKKEAESIARRINNRNK